MLRVYLSGFHKNVSESFEKESYLTAIQSGPQVVLGLCHFGKTRRSDRSERNDTSRHLEFRHEIVPLTGEIIP